MSNSRKHILLTLVATQLALGALAALDYAGMGPARAGVRFPSLGQLFEFGPEPARQTARTQELIRAYSDREARRRPVTPARPAGDHVDSRKRPSAAPLHAAASREGGYAIPGPSPQSANPPHPSIGKESPREPGAPETTAAASETDSARQGFLDNPVTSDGFSLDPFFRSLEDCPSGPQVRIGHYGDSQIEGDRITANLRRLLQAQFGGTGTGFIPLTDVASVGSYERTDSGNWKRHVVFQNVAPAGHFGLSGTFYTFGPPPVADPEPPAADRLAKPEEVRAFVALQMRESVKYDSAFLWYGPVSSPCAFKLMSGDQTLLDGRLTGTDEWNSLQLPLPPGTHQFRIEFVSENSPEFYGLSTSGTHGILVDNFAIRGHTGDGLRQIPESLLSRQGREQNYRLFIFQFGNNAAPYIESQAQCDHFEQVFYRLLTKFRQAVPDAAVLLVGVGDTLVRVNGADQTPPYLRYFRDAQKKAARRAGCAYWDLLEAMGGERSLLVWSEQKLASYDGHLSPAGQQLIAGKLYEDLMEAYRRYLQTVKRKAG